MSIQISGPSIPPDGSVTAAKINSGAATVGFVLTANGAAGATFAELPAAGGGILASGATVGATAQAQIFTTGVGVGASPPAAMLGVRGADSLNTSFAGNISGATGTGLVITNAGNVGIGTTGPTQKLEVAGKVKITGSDLYAPETFYMGVSDSERKFYWGSSTYMESDNDISLSASGNLYFNSTGTAGTEMTITNAGNVGIGTTGPGYPLDIVGGAARIRGTSSTSSLYFNTDGSTNNYGRIEVNNDASFGTSMRFSTYKSAVLTEQMRITDQGNVGIGTTSPTAALHLPASSTARASLCIPAGAAPTIPVEGDVWTASGKMYIYIGAVTKEIAFV